MLEALDRNLCRCGVQRRIVGASLKAGQERRDDPERARSDISDARPCRRTWQRIPACRVGSACTSDGIVDVRVGKVELGQGILTALAQIAADALDVAARRRSDGAAPHTARGPDEGLTVRQPVDRRSGSALRLVCANVRASFVRVAARRWQVAASHVTGRGGQ